MNCQGQYLFGSDSASRRIDMVYDPFLDDAGKEDLRCLSEDYLTAAARYDCGAPRLYGRHFAEAQFQTAEFIDGNHLNRVGAKRFTQLFLVDFLNEWTRATVRPLDLRRPFSLYFHAQQDSESTRRVC